MSVFHFKHIFSRKLSLMVLFIVIVDNLWIVNVYFPVFLSGICLVLFLALLAFCSSLLPYGGPRFFKSSSRSFTILTYRRFASLPTVSLGFFKVPHPSLSSPPRKTCFAPESICLQPCSRLALIPPALAPSLLASYPCTQ